MKNKIALFSLLVLASLCLSTMSEAKTMCCPVKDKCAPKADKCSPQAKCEPKDKCGACPDGTVETTQWWKW